MSLKSYWCGEGEGENFKLKSHAPQGGVGKNYQEGCHEGYGGGCKEKLVIFYFQITGFFIIRSCLLPNLILDLFEHLKCT